MRVVELGSPRLEGAVERRRRVRRAAGQPGGDRDPLLEAGRQRRGRARTARPAGPHGGTGRGDRAEDEVVGRRAGVEAGDVEGVLVAVDGARLRRSARVERDEHRVERVVAVVAAADDGQGQVELRRGEPDDRGEAAQRVGDGHRRPVRRSAAAAPVRPDRAQRLAQGEPLPDREGLRAPVGVDAGGGQRGVHPPGIDRQLAREDVVEHLAAFAEGGLDEPPQLVLGLRVEPVVRFVGLDDDDRRFDRGLRFEGGPRHADGDPHPGVVLHEHGQVAHLPGRRRDPFGDLALDHQDETHRPWRRSRAARAGSGS